MRIRELDPTNLDEIKLVAERMRLTLIDVMGEEKGSEYYSNDWLLQRVRWHLDPNQTNAKIYLSISSKDEITGHAICRLEKDDSENTYGYFSTIYVDPVFRRSGVGQSLIDAVLSWFKSNKIKSVIYNTATNNSKLIPLFQRNGFKVLGTFGEMVKLECSLDF